MPDTELSGPSEQRSRISQEELGNSSSYSLGTKTQESEQYGKALALLGSREVRAHLSLVILILRLGVSSYSCKDCLAGSREEGLEGFLLLYRTSRISKNLTCLSLTPV